MVDPSNLNLTGLSYILISIFHLEVSFIPSDPNNRCSPSKTSYLTLVTAILYSFFCCSRSIMDVAVSFPLYKNPPYLRLVFALTVFASSLKVALDYQFLYPCQPKKLALQPSPSTPPQNLTPLTRSSIDIRRPLNFPSFRSEQNDRSPI